MRLKHIALPIVIVFIALFTTYLYYKYFHGTPERCIFIEIPNLNTSEYSQVISILRKYKEHVLTNAL